MSIEQIASEALRLPAKERALLAGSLWQSLDDPFATGSQSDEADGLSIAIERDEQLDRGEAKTISHEEMMTRLRG